MTKYIQIKESTIKDLYDNGGTFPIPLYLSKIKEFNSSTLIWISFMLSKQKYFEKNNMLDEDGYYYHSQKKIEEEISISESTQTKIIKFLSRLGILLIKENVGLPAKNYYKINFKILFDYIENNGTSTVKSKGQAPLETGDIINNIYNKKANKDILSKERIERPSVVSSSSPSNKLNRRTNSIKIFMKQEIDEKEEAIRKKIEKETPVSIPDSNQKILDYWNQLGLCPITQRSKKAMVKASIEIAKVRRGVKFKNTEFNSQNKKFSDEEIKQAIYNFHLAAVNKDYEPREGDYKMKLRKCSLASFFYNPFSLNSHKSLFLKYLSPPVIIQQKNLLGNIDSEEIINQQVFAKLKNFYCKKVLGNSRLELNKKDLSNVISASNKLIGFYEKQKGIINTMIVKNVNDLTDLFCDVIEKTVDNEHDGDWTKLTSGYMSSDTTFTRRLPAYLNSQAAILSDDSDSRRSIYRNVEI